MKHRVTSYLNWIFKHATKEKEYVTKPNGVKVTFAFTRRGWCPSPGKGQRLLVLEAVS